MTGDMRFELTAASLGALIGGALIWALETWVFSSGTPGVLADFVDWLAPVLGALIFGVLAPLLRHPEHHGGGAQVHGEPPGATPATDH